MVTDSDLENNFVLVMPLTQWQAFSSAVWNTIQSPRQVKLQILTSVTASEKVRYFQENAEFLQSLQAKLSHQIY